MLALGLDTSRAMGSIGLFDDSGRLPSREIPSPPVHSRKLLETLRDVLAQYGAATKDLDVIACACGPGSFTGLRVGMATARGLSLAIKRPVVGFSTLETIAIASAPAVPRPQRIAVLMDAGRGQIYRGCYVVEDGVARAIASEAAVGIEEALRDDAPPCGETSALLVADEALVSGPLGARLRDRGGVTAAPIGATLARRGIALCRAAGEALPPLIPNYLRASDAEKTIAP